MRKSLLLGLMAGALCCLVSACQEQSPQSGAAVGTRVESLGAGNTVTWSRYCRRDEQCGPGRVCEPKGPGCNTPSVCMPGCRDDDDCGIGGTCNQPNCFTCPCPGVCTYDDHCKDDDDCAAGEVCEPSGPNCGAPVCVPGCRDDQDCAIDQQCEERLCVTCPCPGECVDISCASNDDCPEGTVCEPSGPRCGAPICVPGCRDDQDCDNGTRCTQVYCFTCPCPAICL
jgi:hypothetical protein